MAVREKSPFPQTLVLGYSNGNGLRYRWKLGEKARGGYEMEVAVAGTNECGALLVGAAPRLLRPIYDESGRPGADRRRGRAQKRTVTFSSVCRGTT